MTFRSVAAKSHWVVSGLLLTGLFPVLHFLGLPAQMNWAVFLEGYWLSNVPMALVGFGLLAIINNPIDSIATPLRKFRQQPLRVPLMIALFAVLYWRADNNVSLLVIWTALSLIVLEGYERLLPGDFTRLVKTLALPAIYLFVVLVVVFSYINIVVAVKDASAFDSFFLQADRFILAGNSISDFSHAVFRQLPASWYTVVEQIYYSLFMLVGGSIVWLGVKGSPRSSLRLIESIATAYYLSLLIYWWLPAIGPFLVCGTHNVEFPHISTYTYQVNQIIYLQQLSQDRSVFSIGLGYFIAFPSMHIGLAIVVTWFLRSWKRLRIAMIVYDVVLIFSMLALETHYLVDVLGGIVVAATAVYLTEVSPKDEAILTDREGLGQVPAPVT